MDRENYFYIVNTMIIYVIETELCFSFLLNHFCYILLFFLFFLIFVMFISLVPSITRGEPNRCPIFNIIITP